MVFLLCFVSAIRTGLVGLKSGPHVDRLQSKLIPQVVKITKLRISVSISFCLVVSVLETFFKKGSNVVGDALKLFIALGLCSFEPTSDMTSNKRHGYGIWTIVAGLRSMRSWWGKDRLLRENERAGRLTALLLTGI
jgi:hypothetical protein